MCRLNPGLLILFFIGMFLPILSWGQTYEETIDSLLKRLDKTVDMRQKVDQLNDISYAYRRISIDKMVVYAKSAIQLALQIDYQGGLAVAYKNMGIGHFKMGSPPDTSAYYYFQAITVAKQINDYYTQAASLNNLGLIANTKANYNISVQYLHEAISLFDRYVTGKSKISLKCLMLANLGNAYNGLEEYDKAISYLQQAIALAEDHGIAFILAQYLDDLAYSAANKGDYNIAEEKYKAALVWQDKVGDYESKIHTLLHYFEMKLDQQKYAEAEAFALEALEIATRQNFPILIADGLNKLSAINRHTNQIDSAIIYGHRALSQARSIFNIKYEETAEYHLAKAISLKGDYQLAFEHLEAFIRLGDSIANAEKATLSIDLEAKYQNEITQQKLLYLEKNQAVQKRSIKLLIGFVVMTILSLAIISFLLIKRNQSNRIIQKKNEVLEKYIEYNLQLENFAYIASHDLKTPLRNVVSFCQLLSKRIIKKLNTEEKEYLDFIIAGTKEMSSLIDDLLDYSVVQKEKLNLTTIKTEALFHKIIHQNQPLINERKASIVVQSSVPQFYGDPIKVNQLLQNLLTNALKFQPPHQQPSIQISCLDKEKVYLFEIKDNGIGIEEAFYEKVFMIFKRLHSKKDYEGSGIGLAICKKIVEQHGGKIWIESIPNQGTSFFFTLLKQAISNRN